MQLSPHFSLSELTVSETATRIGLDNQPHDAALKNLKRLAAILEQIRTAVGGPIVVTSGYRSPQVNRAINGSMSSAHMTGQAADIHKPGMTPRQLAEAIKSSGVILDQLILEYPDANGWVHVGISTGTPRGQVLTIKHGTGYMAGLV